MNDNPWSAKFDAMRKKESHGLGPQKLDPGPPEIEQEDPIKAGREGACYLALEVLLEFYPTASPYRLTPKGEDGFDHVFLMLNNQPVDVAGLTTIDALREWFRDETLTPAPATLEQIQQWFRGNHSPDEERRYKKLFRHFVREHRPDLFPK